MFATIGRKTVGNFTVKYLSKTDAVYKLSKVICPWRLKRFFSYNFVKWRILSTNCVFSNTKTIKMLNCWNKRACTFKVDEVHQNYWLFRKGQNIGYISTLMQDPSDAVSINEENLNELRYYTQLYPLWENFQEKLVDIKVSKRTKWPYNSPTGSWIQLNYPFSKTPELSIKYKKFTNKEIKVGKILEEIDVLSGESAFRYIKGRRVDLEGVTIVTAAVDQLDFNNFLSIDEDLKINSYVIYAGGSIIYVKSDIYSFSDNSWIFKGHTIFIMAARKDGKSYKVSPMELDNEDDIEMCSHRQILGSELKNYMINFNSNLFKQPPDQIESELIYNLFKSCQEKNGTKKVKMQETLLEHNMMMQMQDRNVYGKIFGGYLMNEQIIISPSL